MTWTTSWANTRKAFRWQFQRGIGLSAAYWVGFILIGLLPERFLRMANFPVQIWLPLWMLVFTFLLPGFYLGCCFDRRQGDMVGALPVPRGCFYIGSMLAGAAVLCAPVIPGMLIRSRFWTDNSGWTLAAAVREIAALLLLGVAAMLFFGLMASGTGNYVEYFLVSLFLSLAPPLVMVAIAYLIERTIPGPAVLHFLYGPISCAISPPLQLLVQVRYGNSLGAEFLLTAALTALYCWAGWAWFRRRPAELSGHPLKCRWMERLARVMTALLASLILGYWACCIAYDYVLEDWGIPLALGVMVLGPVASWIIMELIYRRSLRGLFRHFVPEAAALGLAAVLVAAVSTGLGMDIDIPPEEELLGASVSASNEFANLYLDSLWVRRPGEDETLGLCPGAQSPELLAKVRELNHKLVEMERASQYPYLPGRNAYLTSGSVTFYFFTGEEYWDTTQYSHSSRPTPQSQALIEECDALIEEITCSEEYIEGLAPLCVLDALDEVAYGPMSWGIIESTDSAAENAKAVGDFPKGFMDELEAALREDFLNGRWTYYDDVAEEQNVFQLRYSSNKRFTAKGGMLEDKLAEPAQGEELMLTSKYDGRMWLRFAVSPRMESTYALLEECWRDS